MKQINLTDYSNAIDEEIMWCIKHPPTKLRSKFGLGFQAGLRQAKNIIFGIKEKQIFKKPKEEIIFTSIWKNGAKR